jgi:hypothetical protein
MIGLNPKVISNGHRCGILIFSDNSPTVYNVVFSLSPADFLHPRTAIRSFVAAVQLLSAIPALEQLAELSYSCRGDGLADREAPPGNAVGVGSRSSEQIYIEVNPASPADESFCTWDL